MGPPTTCLTWTESMLATPAQSSFWSPRRGRWGAPCCSHILTPLPAVCAVDRAAQGRLGDDDGDASMLLPAGACRRPCSVWVSDLSSHCIEQSQGYVRNAWLSAAALAAHALRAPGVLQDLGKKAVAAVLGAQTARASVLPRPFLRLAPQNFAVQVPILPVPSVPAAANPGIR